MNQWVVCSRDAGERAMFENINVALDHGGEVISSDLMSRLVRSEIGTAVFYIKSYTCRGRGLRKWLGRSRLRAEWENLLLFCTMGVKTAEVVAYGETSLGGEYRGGLVMRELSGTRDLASMAREKMDLLTDGAWRRHVIHRLSAAVRKLHDQGFIHNDLKWRNILVDLCPDPNVYIIDCPQGRKMRGPFLTRGRVKDLACLDKVAKSALSQTDRLRFYLAYKEVSRLGEPEKREISRVLRFFSGRE